MHVGIYIYDQAEVLDFSGPYEVFSTASRVAKNPELFRPVLISESGGVVTARAGYQVLAHHSIDDHPPLDVMVVSGGVHQAAMKNPEVLGWITAQATQAKVIASVCTGAFLLAAAGVITNQRVTTHWEDIADLRIQFPDLDVVEGVRWIKTSQVVTSAGISAGIDMSLYLVSELHSLELAERTARQMDFAWSRGS